MDFDFAGELWYWRGPSPFHFVTVPADASEIIKDISSAVTYGWGMIPATVRLGTSEWATSLWPKNGGYIVPIKKRVQDAESLEIGDVVTVALSVRLGGV
jgi:hypothetical protein